MDFENWQHWLRIQKPRLSSKLFSRSSRYYYYILVVTGYQTHPLQSAEGLQDGDSIDVIIANHTLVYIFVSSAKICRMKSYVTQVFMVL